MTYDELLEQALRIAQEQYPQLDARRHAAFAHSVAYVVTGAWPTPGGPSVREWAVGCQYRGGSLTFEAAVEVLVASDGIIFGPIRQLHRQIWEDENCFDDDPMDVVELEGQN